MRSLLTLVLGVTMMVTTVTASHADYISTRTLLSLADRFPFFQVLQTEGKPDRFVYADWGRFIRVYQIEKDRAQLVWQSPVLGSQVTSLIVQNLAGEGVPEIIVSTRKGRIIAWSTKNYELIGENLVEPFDNISCLVIGNLDARGGLDAVFIAEGLLNIYDVGTTQRIWRSEKPYAATEMLLANVDDDEQLEIILNSGYIIDSRFFREEYFYQEGFGRRMTLIDINGDDYPEIVGETSSQALLIYDIYGERELFPER